MLPFSGFTNDIKLNSTEKKQAAKSSSKENAADCVDQGTIELFGFLKEQQEENEYDDEVVQISPEWRPKKGDFVIHEPSKSFYKTEELGEDLFIFSPVQHGG